MGINQETKKDLKNVGKIFGKIISILSIVFIVYAIYKLGFDFGSITDWPVFLGVSAICAIVKCITVYLTGSAWADWLRFFAKGKIDTKGAMNAYLKANIGKYLPGNVMHYVERNLFATDLGISQKKLAFGTILEVAGLVGVALIVSVIVSANQLVETIRYIFSDEYKNMLAIAIVLVILVICIVFFIFRKKLSSMISEYTVSDFVKTVFIVLIKYALSLIALGAIMVILYAYMGGELDWNNASLIVSGYIIAWVLGFIIPGAPGGIGIRELVITILLGPVVGTETVLSLSVIHRLITIVGDFLAYFTRVILRRQNI